MCGAPKMDKPQRFQTAQAPVFKEGTEEDMAAKRGRRGTILATAYSGAPVAPGGAKTLLGQ